MEIHELRLDRFHLGILDSLYEGALLVAVSLDGGDGGLIDFLLQRVHTLTLIHHRIAIGKELISEVHDLLFGNLRDTVNLTDLLFPVYLVDKGIHKHIGTYLIMLQSLVVVTLLVVDDARQQVIGEVTLLQLINLCQQQVFHLIQALPILRCCPQQEKATVMHQLGATDGTLHFHGLVQIQVKEASPTIAQHILHQLQGISLQRVCRLGLPSHPDLLCLLANDGSVLGSRQYGLLREYRLFHVSTRFPTAEVLLDDGDGLVWIKISCHTDGHIIRTVPLIEVVLDIRNRWVLQMLL